MTLPTDVRAYPDVVAQALSQLRLVGVNGPYSVLLGADAYTALSETSDHGYPVLQHIKSLVDGEIIWAPAIAGAFVLTTRGGDFVYIGEDVSIGYLSHNDKTVRLYQGDIYLPLADHGGFRCADCQRQQTQTLISASGNETDMSGLPVRPAKRRRRTGNNRALTKR